MKVGMFINTQFPEGDKVAARMPELVEQVRLARDSGFASLLFPHHYLTAPLQMLQITPLMGFLLREAQGMTIGGNILLLPLLNPVHVAEESATLDVLSGEIHPRCRPGLSRGRVRRVRHLAASSGAALHRKHPLMRHLWTGEKVTFQGRFYQVKDHGISLKPLQRGGPPVWVAGLVEAAVQRAAQIGDAWLIANATTLGATGR